MAACIIYSEHSESLKYPPSKNASKQEANKKSHVLRFLILYSTFPITLKAYAVLTKQIFISICNDLQGCYNNSPSHREFYESSFYWICYKWPVDTTAF